MWQLQSVGNEEFTLEKEPVVRPSATTGVVRKHPHHTTIYNQYFGFFEPPFSIAPNPKYLYMSERHREALSHILYGVSGHGGIVLITGEVGTGKTTVCRCFLEQVPENCNIAFIINPRLTVPELLASICDELRVGYVQDESSTKVFVDKINRYLIEAHGRGETTVLIIDEAQNLSAEVIEQLRLLTNLETNQCKLLKIMMIGQPELDELLARNELRQVEQRVTARYELHPLSLDEVTCYILHRLSVAGCQRKLFDSATIRQIYRLSKGIPRTVNLICDRALLGAYTQEDEVVYKETVNRAALEVLGERKISQVAPKRKALRTAVAAALIGGLLMAAGSIKYGGRLWATLTEFGNAVAATVKLDGFGHAEALDGWTLSARGMGQAQVRFDNQFAARASLLNSAYKRIFGLWQITQDFEENSSVCDFAADHELQCVYGNNGKPYELIKYDRPAILLTTATDGTLYPTVVIHAQNGELTVEDEEGRHSLSTQDLANRWAGDYFYLWKPSYLGELPIKVGASGAHILSLKQALKRIDERYSTVMDNFFDRGLSLAVERFQMDHDIGVDGVVGQVTLMKINGYLDSSTPHLTQDWKY